MVDIVSGLWFTVCMSTNEMITRRTSKGYRADESVELLAELFASHQGENLAHALAYNEFATERQAGRFVGAAA